MQVIEIKVYTFDELNDEAKEKARQWYRNIDDFNFAFDNTVEDAKHIGLKLISIDNHRVNEGEFITSAPECAEAIIKEHGESCETYQTAKQYLKDLEAIECPVIDESDEDYDDEKYQAYDDAKTKLDNEFLYSLLEDYRIMYNKDCEYLDSNECIDENITMNEYTFTESGKRFG